MTEAQTEPQTIDQHATPRCEITWQCPEKCCDPERCGQPATEQIVYLCKDKCGRATSMVLAWKRCADAIAATENTLPLVRRSL
jgi:hypothetical protein